MSDLAPVPETVIPADAWIHAPAELEVHEGRKGCVTQLDLERMEAEFLARGGAIQEIPIGVSSDFFVSFNNSPISVNKNRNSPYTPTERQQHMEAKVRRRFAGDGAMVEKIRQHMPNATTAYELYTACQCRADRLQRLLQVYFADDQLAAKFMRRSREEREALIKEHYPRLILQMSETNIAKELRVSLSELRRTALEHGLAPKAHHLKVIRERRAAGIGIRAIAFELHCTVTEVKKAMATYGIAA